MIKKILTVVLLSVVILPLHIFSGDSENESLKIGDTAPKFVLRDLNNEDFFLSDYCGEKLRQSWKNKTKYYVILSFFTSYCQPCRKEIPELEKIVEKYKDQNLKVYLINMKENEDVVSKCISDRDYKLPVLLDKYGVAAKKYGVTSVPRIFVLNGDGVLVWMTKGYEENFAENLSSILEQEFSK